MNIPSSSTLTTRPTLSLPALTPGHEVRHIAAPAHSRSLVSFTTWNGSIDATRMTEDADRDLLIFPTWSDGTETAWALDAHDALQVETRGDDAPGLKIIIREGRTGRVEETTVTGWLRVMRGQQ